MTVGLLKRVLVGSPIPLAQAHRERLGKAVALAVFSSDALSSVPALVAGFLALPPRRPRRPP
jgi:hypothetical protein